jgi:hypothetical protein
MWRSREHVLSETRVCALEGITTRQIEIVAGVFVLLLFTVADTISDIPLFPSVSADLSNLSPATEEVDKWQRSKSLVRSITVRDKYTLPAPFKIRKRLSANAQSSPVSAPSDISALSLPL